MLPFSMATKLEYSLKRDRERRERAYNTWFDWKKLILLRFLLGELLESTICSATARLLRYPHKKKSIGVRLSDLRDKGMSPRLETRVFGNHSLAAFSICCGTIISPNEVTFLSSKVNWPYNIGFLRGISKAVLQSLAGS